MLFLDSLFCMCHWCLIKIRGDTCDGSSNCVFWVIIYLAWIEFSSATFSDGGVTVVSGGTFGRVSSGTFSDGGVPVVSDVASGRAGRVVCKYI